MSGADATGNATKAAQAPNRPIVNLDELGDGRFRAHGERFERRLSPVATRIGASKLGYNITRVAPGKSASPFHSHHVNEEMFFILEGSGTLRFGTERFAVRSGDFIACPPGDAAVAHQLINGGDRDLLYLAVSTKIEGDAWAYPDSGKVGVAGPETAGGADADRYYFTGSAVDYWDGET